MVKWEYHLERSGSVERFEHLTSRLNTLGDEGWEAIGVSEYDQDRHCSVEAPQGGTPQS